MAPRAKSGPTFIGIGAERCATTWCWACLDEHPDVTMTHPKELDFFSLHYKRGPAWYASHFADSTKPIAGEISPSYMMHEEAAARMAKAFPGATLFAILRNPFERAESHLMLDMQTRLGAVSDATLSRARTLVGDNPRYVRNSLYARGLRPYVRRFPRSRLHVFLYEDIVSSPRIFLRRLFQVVGADPGFVPAAADEVVNRSKDFRSHALFRGLRLLSRGAKSLPIASDLLEGAVRIGARDAVLRVLQQDRGRRRFDFCDVFAARDRDAILCDLEELRGDLGIPVPSSWIAAP